jgi:hypothetical protein
MDTKSPLVTRLKKTVSPCSLAAASGLFLLIFLMASQELGYVLLSLLLSRLHNSLEQPSPERLSVILMRAESGDPSSCEGPVHPGLLLQEIDVGPVPGSSAIKRRAFHCGHGVSVRSLSWGSGLTTLRGYPTRCWTVM